MCHEISTQGAYDLASLTEDATCEQYFSPQHCWRLRPGVESATLSSTPCYQMSYQGGSSWSLLEANSGHGSYKEGGFYIATQTWIFPRMKSSPIFQARGPLLNSLQDVILEPTVGVGEQRLATQRKHS